MKEVAARLPDVYVTGYSEDVLRRPNLSILDDDSKIKEDDPMVQVAASSSLDEEDVEDGFMTKLVDHFLAGTPRHMTIRLRTKIKLANSPGGQGWDIFQVALSLIACVMHILSTYKENALEDDEAEVVETPAEKMLELVLSALFAIDLVMHYYVCDHRIWFFTQGDTIVDVLTLFPVVISIAGGGVPINTSFLRALRMLRAMRILRAFRITKNSLSAVDQKVATLVIIVVSIIFMSACLVQTLEKESGMQDFGVAMYFVVVTISTVGYGDYSPVTPAGRVVVCIMIIGFMVIVPVKISELADLLAMRSPWHITYHAKAGFRNILLVGSVLEPSEVEAFLEEFFHPDRMRLTTDLSLPSTEVVIMGPTDPTEAMVSLLFVPFWQGQVYYTNGSALSDKDLKRAGLKTAEACFILIGKRSSPPRSVQDQSNNQELIDYYDSQNVLYALMVENFNHRADTFVQIRGIEKRYPLVAAEADVVLCIDRLRMTILGSTALFPGLCTFMSNLWQSCSDAFLDAESPFDSKSKGQLGDANVSKEATWKSEYSRSRGMEIYVRPVCTDLFAGLSFSQAAFVVHRAFNGEVTLLGVEERLVSYDVDDLPAEKQGHFTDGPDENGSSKWTEKELAESAKPHFRILRSLVAPGDKYIFPNQTAVNLDRMNDAAYGKGVDVERLQINAYFLADDGEQADLFTQPHAYLANILHSLHEFAYLNQHMKFGDVDLKEKAALERRRGAQEALAKHEFEVEQAACKLALAGHEAAHLEATKTMHTRDAAARTRIIDSATTLNLSGHYIILTPPSSLPSLNDVLIPLRGGTAVQRPELVPCLNCPIIILLNKLNDNDLPISVLRTVQQYSQVYIVFGDHNSVSDLKRSGIFTAKSIVIIEDNDGMKSQGSEIHTATITKFLSTEQCLTMAMEDASDEHEQASPRTSPRSPTSVKLPPTIGEDDVALSAASQPSPRRKVSALHKSYVVETNSKATMTIMNRSVLNRLAHERIDREVSANAFSQAFIDPDKSSVLLKKQSIMESSALIAAEAEEEKVEASSNRLLSAAGGAADADTEAEREMVKKAMVVRGQKRAIRKAEALKQEQMEAHEISNADTAGLTPFFAAGYCFSTAVFDNLLVLSYFARGVLRFTESLLGLDPNLRPPVPEEVRSLQLDPAISSGQIIQISIPIDPVSMMGAGSTKESVTLTYSQVFDLLLVNHEAVVIAVYRAAGKASELPYVAMPKHSEAVDWDDKLFVVAPPHQVELLLRGVSPMDTTQPNTSPPSSPTEPLNPVKPVMAGDGTHL